MWISAATPLIFAVLLFFGKIIQFFVYDRVTFWSTTSTCLNHFSCFFSLYVRNLKKFIKALFMDKYWYCESVEIVLCCYEIEFDLFDLFFPNLSFIYPPENMFLGGRCIGNEWVKSASPCLYRNQSINIDCRSMVWLLYDNAEPCPSFLNTSVSINEIALDLTFNPLTTNVSHHIETIQLICSANQLTGFYMVGNTVQ